MPQTGVLIRAGLARYRGEGGNMEEEEREENALEPVNQPTEVVDNESIQKQEWFNSYNSLEFVLIKLIEANSTVATANQEATRIQREALEEGKEIIKRANDYLFKAQNTHKEETDKNEKLKNENRDLEIKKEKLKMEIKSLKKEKQTLQQE
jgi:hypothetical protein